MELTGWKHYEVVDDPEQRVKWERRINNTDLVAVVYKPGIESWEVLLYLDREDDNKLAQLTKCAYEQDFELAIKLADQLLQDEYDKRYGARFLRW